MGVKMNNKLFIVLLLVFITGCQMFTSLDKESLAYIAGQGVVAGYIAKQDSISQEQVKTADKVIEAFLEVMDVLGTSDVQIINESAKKRLKEEIKDEKQYALACQLSDICWHLITKNIDLDKMSEDERLKILFSFCKGMKDAIQNYR